MACYAVGDVQGCHDELRSLLDLCKFDPAVDRLWLVGDLVNRGPDSAGVLRFVRSLGAAAVVVLGNHDLYLVKVASSPAVSRKRHDTLQDVLDAPDRDELIDWLRTQPLMHVDGSFALVHAGLLPCWSIERAASLAREVEAVLAGPDWRDFMQHLWGNRPAVWHDALIGYERYRVVVNAMTRMRFCSLSGSIEFDAKGPPESAPPGHLPWFEHPDRASRDATVVFGHWSALGFRRGPDYLALDSGCVWGGTMTAVRLEDRMAFQVAAGKMRPCA
ncbi:MAG: symmetrical bis(5'-nucleosyl)-tetraphosphatase [Rhodocyclaceae bacterium]|nr:symmetrical bis(5'-nucleosyl)-tetraphosphatase [Rhodocyclaceae bacterium]